MRKTFITLAVLATCAVGSAQAQNYQSGYNNGQNQAWQNAAVGAAINLGGMVVGNIMQRANQPNQGYYVAQGYGPAQGYAPAPGYMPPPPPVVNPYYYPRAQACVTQRAPVYNAYGQITEFVQYCANPAR